MMLSKSVFFTLFAASGVLSQFTWKDCGSPHGQITSIQAVPAVPQKGKSFKINGSGVILKEAQTVKFDEQLKDLPDLGSDLVDTTDTHNKSELGFSGNIEVTSQLSFTGQSKHKT